MNTPQKSHKSHNNTKSDYYVNKHPKQTHHKPSSLSPNPPHSSKNKKIQKNNSHVSHPRDTTDHSSTSSASHIRHNTKPTPIVVEIHSSPDSPKPQNKKHTSYKQSATNLSLSPVSPNNFSQFIQQCSTSDNNTYDSDTNPGSLSPISQTRFTQAMIVVDSVSTSDTSDSNSDLSSHTPSDIPNIFQCTKEPSIIRGEKREEPQQTSKPG